MNITDILIVLACLAGGYWLVNSVMGPGIDITRKDDADKAVDGAPAVPVARAANPHRHDWHLVLDVSADATRSDIRDAYKRRLAQAQSAGNTLEADRIRLAYEAAQSRQ